MVRLNPRPRPERGLFRFREDRSAMQVVVKELDQTRIHYEAMVQRVGEGDAALAFSRALNHEGRKSFTAVKRALRKQTDIPAGMISAAMKFENSSRKNLTTIIRGKGSELPLRIFGARQFKYGVRAKVWGKTQVYKSQFIVAKLGGNVFHRTSRKRLPIQKTFGPSIPKEMVKDVTLETFERSGNAVMDRAMHELSRILKV
jgi:hypothetical protein